MTARPAVQRNTEKMELTYAGNEPFFGVDARKYWITEDGVSPWTDEPKAMIAVYEHALESRPYAVMRTRSARFRRRCGRSSGPPASRPRSLLSARRKA